MRYAVIRDFGKKNICQLAAIVLLSMSLALQAAAAVPGRKKATAPPVRVACVGNSITYGTGIQDRARDSYPAQLQRMLGPGYVRRNLYINVSRVGNSLVVRFDYADELSTADGRAPSTFEIAEEEGLYHPATAVIAGCTVVLTSPEVKHPRLVRYGWQPKRTGQPPQRRRVARFYLQRRSGRARLTGEGKLKYLVYAQFFSADI